MRVLFIFMRETHYDSTIVRQSPCGGTEKSAIFLGEALRQLGYEVTWITTIPEMQALNRRDFDFVITQDASLLSYFPNSKRIWWVHHFADAPEIQRISMYGRMFADQIVTLSQCQHKQYLEMLNLPTTVIGYGMWHDELAPQVEKTPFSMIYASTPFRGLHLLPAMFRQIRSFQPQARLTVCSSMKTYGYGPEQDAQYQALFDELKSIEGITLTGSMNQGDLYSLFAQTAVFLYPCTFTETYCLVMDEAIAHGCIPVVPDVGALPERFPPAGNTAESLLDMVKHVFERPNLSISDFNQVHQPISWLEIGKRWQELVLTSPDC